MVEEVRNKWCTDLEDLLQCPVCMERPTSAIFQCIQGHHICQLCKTQLGTCPTCSQRWSDSRNRLAEHLCLKLEEIKISLIDPENEINKFLIPETVSVASQTEEILVTAVANAPVANRIFDQHDNKPYPCRIDSCEIQTTYENIRKHLMYDHVDLYCELHSNGPVFEHGWTFEFKENMIFDQAFLIEEMGTFFLKLTSDVFGNLTGFTSMVHNTTFVKNFTYQLDISCCPEHSSIMYTGEVPSCRTSIMSLQDTCLKSKHQEVIKLLKHQKMLTCTLLLGKRSLSEDGQRQNLPRNKGKKNRFRPQQSERNGPNGSNFGYQPVFNRQPKPQTAPNGQPARYNLRENRPNLRTASVDRALNMQYPNTSRYV